MATGGSDNEIERSHGDNWRETRTSAQCLSYLCLSQHLSDISFTFSADKSVKLPAHKFVLSMRSSVFEAMFYGPLSESGNNVYIKDVEPEIMKDVLQYIYSDQSSLDESNVLPCLYTANKYDLSGLVQRCSDYLENNIDECNVCSVHEQAIMYKMKPLQDRCLLFISENTSSVLSSPDFLKLSHASLLHILKQDALGSNEVEIFQAAMRWAENSKMSQDGQILRNQLGDVLFQIRFPIMPIEEFARVVTPSDVLTGQEVVMLYEYNATKGSTPTGQFSKQLRSGTLIKIDLSRCISNLQKRQRFAPVVKGCTLELEYYEDNEDDDCSYDDEEEKELEFRQTLQSRKKSSIKLKSVSGTFIDKVREIKVNGTKKDYRLNRDEIIFNDPIDNSNQVKVEFLFNSKDDGYPSTQNNHKTYKVNHKENIQGRTSNIKRVPEGLEFIAFEL